MPPWDLIKLDAKSFGNIAAYLCLSTGPDATLGAAAGSAAGPCTSGLNKGEGKY